MIGENGDIDDGDLDVESFGKLSMMCWNVSGWSNLSMGELQSGRCVGENDARTLVLKQYQPHKRDSFNPNNKLWRAFWV